MTPLQDSSKEIEIPQEFSEKVIEAATKYDYTAERFFTSKGMGFVAGAEWAFRHLHPSPSGWINCKERLPEKFKNVLCYSNKGQYAITCVDASGELDTFHLEVENGAEFYTHWQPLLPPLITGVTP